jgi:thiamine biosynthesis lipoprotein
MVSQHMGTTFRIIIDTDDRATAETAVQAAWARIATLDAIMSDYKPDSELMRVCRANDVAPAQPQRVSPELFDILQQAQSVSAASNGAFDVTVGPVVRLWRVARRTQVFPEAQELSEALGKVGYQKLTLDAKNHTVTLAVPGMRLDLGGIAKGYAADAALRVLRTHGFPRALVAASGDITTGAPPRHRDGWTVDIAPLEPGQPPRRLRLANAAVSTSGDLFQFVEMNGVRYSHILDPRTGIGLTGRRSVTVIAPTGVQADSLSKVASVLPPAQGLSHIDSIPGAAALIVTKESEDAPVQITQSRRFREFVDPTSQP